MATKSKVSQDEGELVEGGWGMGGKQGWGGSVGGMGRQVGSTRRSGAGGGRWHSQEGSAGGCWDL